VGEEAMVIQSVSHLSSRIDGNLLMTLTFSHKNTSKIPVGLDETDSEKR